jgi:hypothetical protein
LTHLIEVTKDGQADLQPARPSGRLEVVKLDLGEVIEGRVRCYVEDLGENYLVEVADISLADGTGTLLRVPCRSFRFRDG